MVNEKRLIYAEDAKEALLRWETDPTDEEIEYTIDKLPTVDAVEVVRGRWEDAYGGKYANPRYRCSVCKEKALFKWERDVLGSYKEVQALTPNCPYCMAKMDGDGNA